MDNFLYLTYCFLTLQANHKFVANTYFGFFDHPRFGSIRTITTSTFVKKGEECYVNYDYDLKAEGIPDWYLNLHKEFYAEKNRLKMISKYLKTGLKELNMFT